MNVRELVKELRREQLLAEPACHHPLPPRDGEAEKAVCAALLAGCVRPGDLDGLEASHFAEPLWALVYRHGCALRAAGKVANWQTVALAIHRAGEAGPDLTPELQRFFVSHPVALPLHPRVERVIALAARRVLWGQLHTMLAALDVPDAEIFERLRAAAKPFAFPRR
jgi:hypothetical protein